MITPPISILKSIWSRGTDGRWGIAGSKGLDLKPKPGFDADYFMFESDVELMTSTPSKNIHEVLASFGTTDFLMKQSVLPVVAWREGDQFIRCLGTASVISCSGYVMTAAHVLMDPFDSGYSAVRRNNQLEFADTLNVGVIVPTSPAYGARGLRIFPFEKFWLGAAGRKALWSMRRTDLNSRLILQFVRSAKCHMGLHISL